MCMVLVDSWPFLTADDVNVILIIKIDEIYSDSQRVRVLHPIVSEVGVSSLKTFKMINKVFSFYNCSLHG